LSEMIDKSGM